MIEPIRHVPNGSGLPRAARGMRWWRLGPCLVLLIAALASGGCSSIRVTDPPRTATEQFLLSGAAAKAVVQLDFDPLRGRRVFVDSTYFAASEQQFVLGELRTQLLLAGVRLVPAREEAEIVMEVRSGGVGIDRSDFLLGLPSLVLSADEGSDSSFSIPFVTPEIALLKNIEQWGIASVAFIAYWRETGELVASSGPYIGWTTRDDWWIFGFGPQTLGNVPPVNTPEPSELDLPTEQQVVPADDRGEAVPGDAAGAGPAPTPAPVPAADSPPADVPAKRGAR